MSEIGKMWVSLGLEMEQWSKGLKQAQSELKEIGDTLSTAGMTLTAGVTLPLAGLATAALQSAGALEQNRVALTTMLGSVSQANSLLKDLQDFSAKTPFEFPGLADASKKMLALGFSAKDLIPTLRAVGDAAASMGGSPEQINRIILALGQMRAKGKVSAEEMRQLSEANIKAWDMLAKKIGVSVPEAMKLAEKGAIDAETAIGAIVKGMGDQFKGMMEQQSKTLLGVWSNFRENLGYTLADIGQALAPIAKRILEEFLIPATAYVSKMAKAFGELPKPVQNTAIALAAIAAAAGPVLFLFGSLSTGAASMLGLFRSLATGASALAKAVGAGELTSGVKMLNVALAAMAAAVVAIQLKGLISDLTELGQVVTGSENPWTKLKEALFGISEAAPKAAAQTKNLTDTLRNSVQEVSLWSTVVRTARDAWQEFKDKVSGVNWINMITGPLGALRESVSTLTEIIKQVTGKYPEMEKAGQAVLKNIGASNKKYQQEQYEATMKVVAAQQEHAKAAGEVTIQARMAAAEMAKMAAAFTTKANDILRDLPKTMEEFRQATEEGFSGKSSIKQMAEMVSDLENKYQRIPPAVQGIVNKLKEAIKQQREFVEAANAEKWVANFNKIATEFADSQRKLESAFRKSMDNIKDEAKKPIKINLTLEQQLDPAYALKKELEEIEQRMRVLKMSGKEATVEFENLAASATTVKDKISEAGDSVALKMLKSTQELQAAMTAFGITSTATIDAQLSKSEAYFKTMQQGYENGRIGVRELLLAEEQLYLKRIESARAHGEDATALQNHVNAVKASLQEMGYTTSTLKKTLDPLTKQVSTILTDMGRGIADAIVAGKGAVEVFKSALKELEKAVVRFSVEIIGKYLFKQIKASITELTSMNNALAKSIKKVTDLIGVTTGTPATTVPGGTPTMPGTKGAGSFGGLAGTVTAISSVVSAITDILGYFQTRRMEKDIGRIEVTSREISAELQNFRRDAWTRDEGWWKVKDELYTKWDNGIGGIINLLVQIKDAIQSGNFSPGASGEEVPVNATEQAKEATQAVADALLDTAQHAEDLSEASADAAKTVIEYQEGAAELSGVTEEYTEVVEDAAEVVEDSTETASDSLGDLSSSADTVSESLADTGRSSASFRSSLVVLSESVQDVSQAVAGSFSNSLDGFVDTAESLQKRISELQGRLTTGTSDPRLLQETISNLQRQLQVQTEGVYGSTSGAAGYSGGTFGGAVGSLTDTSGWNFVLNVDVNNADAKQVADKIVTTLRQRGVAI